MCASPESLEYTWNSLGLTCKVRECKWIVNHSVAAIIIHTHASKFDELSFGEYDGCNPASTPSTVTCVNFVMNCPVQSVCIIRLHVSVSVPPALPDVARDAHAMLSEISDALSSPLQ